jgi:hypothetical protein
MEKQQQLATEQENRDKKNQKIGFDGWAFYFLIFSVIVLLPLASVIILVKSV